MESARKNPGAAFVLSLIPGAGHVYAGRIGKGVIWLIVVFVAYDKLTGMGLFLHFICAVSAGLAATAANRAEAQELASRRESADEVATLLDRAASARGAPQPLPPSPAAPGPADPPPRILRAAFPVPPLQLLQSLAEAMGRSGLLVLGVDREHLRIRASIDLGGGSFSSLIAQVEETPAGSRVRLMIDRPEGSVGGAEVDDRVLRGVIDETERALGRPAGGVAEVSSPRSAAAVRGEGEALTEDHFFEQLREAWEAYEQGWLPEQEWLDRKLSLLRSVTLRTGTRPGDVMTACRPLVEAGILDTFDLRALEMRLGVAR